MNGTADGTKGVHLKIYFDGNFSTKTTNIANQSPTVANPYAGNLQFYGISPTTPGRDPNNRPQPWRQRYLSAYLDVLCAERRS